MKAFRNLLRNEAGATVVEMAFALPVFVVMIWMIAQLGMMFHANAGIQQALGEGARFATLCKNPGVLGCNAPTRGEVKAKMQQSVDGDNYGTFDAQMPVQGTSGGATFYDLTVTYTMPTSLLLFPGPDVSITKKKRVWISS